MNIKKILLICLAALGITLICIVVFKSISPPILVSKLATEKLGEISVAEPMWGTKALAIVFADTKTFPAENLARKLAETGATAAIMDSSRILRPFTAASGKCLGPQFLSDSINALNKALPAASKKPLIVAGINDGALIPFINAQSAATNSPINISIGFSVNLPSAIQICPPLIIHNQQLSLMPEGSPISHWRSVWTDQPDDQTSIFFRALGKTDTWIAPYDTPLDTVLAQEIKSAIGQTDTLAPPMPVVEVPVKQSTDSLTIFYSGDGGWRDLDKSVAGQMAAANYPVVGVDVLRYFWEPQTPEQAAADLSATMAYYRQHWGVKSFILAGYSFGADIIPHVFNRLPLADQNSVQLFVFLALAKSADFEIHVSGWLGKTVDGQALLPELAKLAKDKIFCVYGRDEIMDTACTGLQDSPATVLELPGGHHFDEDYPKLTRQILDVYRQHGIR